MTHDRYFLDNAAQWILELDRGRGIPFEGNYSSWLEQKEARLAAEERSNESRRRSADSCSPSPTFAASARSCAMRRPPRG